MPIMIHPPIPIYVSILLLLNYLYGEATVSHTFFLRAAGLLESICKDTIFFTYIHKNQQKHLFFKTEIALAKIHPKSSTTPNVASK